MLSLSKQDIGSFVWLHEQYDDQFSYVSALSGGGVQAIEHDITCSNTALRAKIADQIW